jgi:hypothetical protein
MRETDRGKRETLLQTLDDEAKQKVKHSPWHKPDRLPSIIPEGYPTAEELVDSLLKVKSDPAAKAKFIRELFADSVVAERFVQNAGDRAEQTQRNLHIAFALGAYQREHGDYPKTLDALAPNYLPSVPKDLFTGKPLVYRPEKKGYLLYSFGPNGKDDGGQSRTVETLQADDISVRMPRVEPGKK